MLNRDKNIIIVFLLFLIACETNMYNNESDLQEKDFHVKDIYVNNYFYTYSSIYQMINDSLQSWKLDSLSVSKSYFFKESHLDSIIIFNTDSTCLFTMLEKKGSEKDKSADFMSELFGRKINNQWYFFFSSVSMVLPRAGMKDSIYNPFTFEEMSYLAFDQKFRRLVKNKISNNDIKNDSFFISKFSSLIACSLIRNQINWKCVDSLVISRTVSKYKNKITRKEILQFKKIKEKSVKPVLPVKKKIPFWKDDPQIPLFETEEWKAYLKKKYGNKWQDHM